MARTAVILVAVFALTIAAIVFVVDARLKAKRARACEFAMQREINKRKKRAYCINCKHGLTVYRESRSGLELEPVECELEKPSCGNFERKSPEQCNPERREQGNR